MSLTIDLAPSEEQHLAEQAAQQGVPVSAYVRRLIQGSLEAAAHDAKKQRAMSTLRGWIESARESSEGEPNEEARREAHAWEEAARAVDENRLSYRRRFEALGADASP